MKKTVLLIITLLLCSMTFFAFPTAQTAHAARFNFATDYEIMARDMDGAYIVGAINIKDYGAVGDGVADDTDAFETALDELVTGPRSGVLFLPAGEYRITKPGFQLLKGVTIMGENQNNLNVKKTIQSGYGIYIPAGYYHNIINTGNQPLKLISTYAPVEHPFGTVHATKEIAEQMENY